MGKGNNNEVQINIKMEENILTSLSVQKVCLICCSTIIPSSPLVQPPPCHQSSQSLLTKQLNIVYILRNLLQVPAEKLETYLKDFGNPENWSINLCDQCTLLTNNAIELNYQLAVITNKIKEIQGQIWDKIRNSSSDAENNFKGNKDVNIVVLEARSFVKESQAENILEEKLNSFLEGDRLAEQLNQKSKLIEISDPFPATFKEEPNNFDDNPADNDDDWLSSSSSSSSSESPPPSPSPPSSKPKNSSRPKTPRRSRAKSKIDPNRKTRYFPLNKFICNLCPPDKKLSFRYASTWKAHLESDHNTQTVTCPEPKCKGLSFDKLGDYLTHRQKVHLFKEPRKCEICGKTFNCLPTYYSHKTLKHDKKGTPGNGKDWICDYCGKAMGARNSLKSHLKYKHNRDINGKELTVQKHVCEICGLELKSVAGVKAHRLFVHEGKNTANCHLCGKELKNKFNLKQHLIRRHKEEAMEEVKGMKVGGKGSELWRCRVPGCPRYYFEKCKLEQHRIEAHGLKGEGEGDLIDRPFKCEKCGQGFWLRNKLKDHEKVHEREGKTDWKCEECGKGFAFKKYMRDHMVRMHKISREELDRREKEGRW